ncbi:MAG: hypothetical protein NTX50_10780 [Candidatus Sumerlaeota bacterium]|nr:hypothetical protein [Candidatus Sumerlaeota bacterium]
MKEDAERHFAGVRQILPTACRLMLFDYDDSEKAFHPKSDNPSLFEWDRKNIENYLLVPNAWERSALKRLESNVAETSNAPKEQSALQRLGIKDDLLAQPIKDIINEFFAEENLMLPPRQTWRFVEANIFKVVDGKKLLFENEKSLFQRLRHHQSSLEMTREVVALAMKPDEIHENVHVFFNKVKELLVSIR